MRQIGQQDEKSVGWSIAPASWGHGLKPRWSPDFFRLPYAITKIASITVRIIAYLTSYPQFNKWFISYIISSKMTFLQFWDPFSGVDFHVLELFIVLWVVVRQVGGGGDTDKLRKSQWDVILECFSYKQLMCWGGNRGAGAREKRGRERKGRDAGVQRWRDAGVKCKPLLVARYHTTNYLHQPLTVILVTWRPHLNSNMEMKAIVTPVNHSLEYMP